MYIFIWKFYLFGDEFVLGRMWCHCRLVYLPMSYLYGKRYVAPMNATTRALRKELYTKAYDEIDWDLARNQCATVQLPSILCNHQNVFYSVLI